MACVLIRRNKNRKLTQTQRINAELKRVKKRGAEGKRFAFIG
jgi:hypothetical protein